MLNPLIPIAAMCSFRPSDFDSWVFRNSVFHLNPCVSFEFLSYSGHTKQEAVGT